MNFSAIFSPIKSFLVSAALKLTSLDGKPGLSFGDFERVVAWVGVARGLTGRDKHAYVLGLVNKTFGSSIPSWVADIVVFLAYAYAQRK